MSFSPPGPDSTKLSPLDVDSSPSAPAPTPEATTPPPMLAAVLATPDESTSRPKDRMASDSVQIARTPVQDALEQIFQRVEEESARRALKEELEEERSRPGTASSPAAVSGSAVPSAASPAVTAVSRDVANVRDRRRGSISVSRFGQATDLSSGTYENASNLPSRKNSIIIKASSTGAFYQAQRYAGSADSFASDFEGEQQRRAGGRVHEEYSQDEEQVTQMETIAGRVSLGKAMGRTIARRLSRARSRDILAVPGPNGLVIGVSVEEATVEAEHHEDDSLDPEGEPPRTPHGTAFVYADVKEGPSTRSRRSTVSMPNQNLNPPATAPSSISSTGEKKSTASNWMAKAKDLTKKFKRKSMAVLPQNSSP